MKRKLSVVLFMMALVGVCLAGCGSKDGSTSGEGKSQDTIAFSELFEDDVVIYKLHLDADETFAGKDEDIEGVNILKANGDYSGYAQDFPRFGTLGEFSKMNDTEVIDAIDSQENNIVVKGTYKIGIETNSTGNAVNTEKALFKTTSKSGSESITPDDPKYSELKFGTFVEHVTIYDVSYMMFEITSSSGTKEIRLIKDTDKTKDKTVVFDSTDNSNVLVDVEAKDAFK